MPKYSVVIPTRERHRTLKHAIESVLCQTFRDLEVVVMDNASGAPTKEVVDAFTDDRVRHVVAPERLAMSDNWELGLSHAKGDFVFVLGDDDALLPDGIARVEAALAVHDVSAVSWPKNVTYWWADAIVVHHRNRLYVDFAPQPKVQVLESRPLLEKFYVFEMYYEGLPSLYSSFVHKSVIDAVRSKHGKYFLTSIPDVYSAVVNAFFTDRFVGLPFGASISGNSGASTGTSYVNPNLNSASKDRFDAENRGKYGDLHPALIDSPSLEVAFANEGIRIREAFFPDEEALTVRIDQLIGAMLGGLNRNAALYETILSDTKRLAAKYGVTIPDEVIPPRVEPPTQGYRGMYRAERGVTLAIDCEVARITNAAEAARLACAMQPGL